MSTTNAFETGVLFEFVSWDPSEGGGYYSYLLEQSSWGPRAQGGGNLRTIECQSSETERKGKGHFLQSPFPFASLRVLYMLKVRKRSAGQALLWVDVSSWRKSPWELMRPDEGTRGRNQTVKGTWRTGTWNHRDVTSQSGSKLAWRCRAWQRCLISGPFTEVLFWRWI